MTSIIHSFNSQVSVNMSVKINFVFDFLFIKKVSSFSMHQLHKANEALSDKISIFIAVINGKHQRCKH